MLRNRFRAYWIGRYSKSSVFARDIPPGNKSVALVNYSQATSGFSGRLVYHGEGGELPWRA